MQSPREPRGSALAATEARHNLCKININSSNYVKLSLSCGNGPPIKGREYPYQQRLTSQGLCPLEFYILLVGYTTDRVLQAVIRKKR
jgi:hypothetical protein